MTKLATDTTAHRYKRHRFPAEVIAHAVWLYHRFPLSLRDVEDLLAKRGIDVSFQTVSEWTVKFGRNKKAAIRLMRKLLKNQGLTPRVMVTDKLRSYSAAKAELISSIEHVMNLGDIAAGRWLRSYRDDYH